MNKRKRRRVRPYQEPRNNVPKHHGLLEPVEQEGDDASNGQDDREILKE
jgi:hypothetical protein